MTTTAAEAKKYNDFACVKRYIVSCKTIKQTLMAEAFFKRFCAVHHHAHLNPAGAMHDDCRELRHAMDLAQRRLFGSEEEFEGWAKTNPRWAHRLSRAPASRGEPA
jgi:hypothetical protein